MIKYSPLKFQSEAIQKITDCFQTLWQRPEKQRHLVFKSPTGSGKTFMICNFIHNLNSLPNWDYDKAIIWVTFSDNLAMQSKLKFQEYFNTNLENNLLTIENFTQGKLLKNDVLFINWQKLVSRSADTRVLRRPDDENFLKEQGYYFEDIIENTKKEGREIIMVVDESHTHLSSLAQTSVVDVVNPKVIINVSATPKYIPTIEEVQDGSAGYVSVKREDVVEEGLIKEKIAVQTDEDLHKFEGRDLDELLIDLAISKKTELEKEYQDINKNINPLVLIQLPNDDSRLIDAGQKTKEQIVLDYLTKKRIDIDNKVALWFDGKQKNMEYITHNESDVDFMLFKQAAGTGWDCPRAHILIMFREINSPTFYTQTIGRILRTAEPYKKEDYKEKPKLRTGYLFTNYKRNEIGIPDQSIKNKPFIHYSNIKENISNIEGLRSEFVSRADYGDLGNSFQFQSSFLNSLKNFFGIEENELIESTRPKFISKKVNLKPQLTNSLIVDAEFTDYDKLNLEFEKQGHDEEYEISRNDVEKLFNFWCFKILTEQTDSEAKVSNVSRSWSPLKSALRVFFKQTLDLNSDYYYRVFLNDINNEQSSVFRQAITKALKEYYPIKKEFVKKRQVEIEEREAPIFEIKNEYYFTEDFAELSASEGTSLLSAIQPFFLRKVYNGRDNELKFIKYLEQKSDSLEWWFKNGEGSKDFYCLKYLNTSTNVESLFYPDWILKFKDGRIGIFDTKSGFTAQNTEGRAEALALKIIELNQKGGNYVGGIAILENNQWYYSSNINYNYTPGNLSENWCLLEKLF
jgi:type III restriction enzyme